MNLVETQQTAEALESTPSPDPLDASLFGEYSRLALIGAAACTSAHWAMKLGDERLALVMVVAGIVVLGALASTRFAGLPRLAIVLSVIVGIAITVGVDGNWLGTIPFFSPAVMVVCLALLGCRDLLIAFRKTALSISWRTIAIGLVCGVAFAYLVVVPTLSGLFESSRDQPTSYVVEELTFWQVLRIRSAKLMVFAIFAYFGACIGSFLNVVAASAPRGEATAFRSSECPKCHSPIRRIDNLPIFSFLVLGGRCRDCNAAIPIRYLGVELIAAGIFAVLFIFELVSGAANVPGLRQYHYTGIVWIILYTKWPIVGIYFYHVAMFCFVLLFALMESDKLRCPPVMAFAIIAVFVCLAIALPVLQPVAFDDQLPVSVSQSMPSWATRAATCLAGGLMGWLISLLVNRISADSPSAIAWILLGVALGWQATAMIAAFWGVATIVTGRIRWRLRPAWVGPTAMLFAVSFGHHLAWKWLSRLW